MNGFAEPARASTCFAAPAAVDAQLRAAAQVYADTSAAEAILQRALSMDTKCLATYFSLYKFYFYKHQLLNAEGAALMALEAAARQGGFNADWHRLDVNSSDWSRVDSPQHFYLFTLKALAFIRLRLNRRDEACAILDKLVELDPRDSVGADVIRALAAGANAERELTV
jgi:tetratricopeptide (TPR) repeat protein